MRVAFGRREYNRDVGSGAVGVRGVDSNDFGNLKERRRGYLGFEVL